MNGCVLANESCFNKCVSHSKGLLAINNYKKYTYTYTEHFPVNTDQRTSTRVTCI